MRSAFSCSDAEALENRVHEEEQLEENARHLVAFGDFILNEIQAARLQDLLAAKRQQLACQRRRMPGRLLDLLGILLNGLDIGRILQQQLYIAENHG